MSFLCVCLAAVFAGVESNESVVTSKGYSDVFVPFVVTLLFLIGKLCTILHISKNLGRLYNEG